MLQTIKNWLHKRRAPQPNIAQEKASTYAPDRPEHLHLHWHVSDITQIPAQFIWHSPGSIEFNRLKSAPQPTSQSPAYDSHLLDNARTQWQFGDWDSLVKLERENLQHHPDRAKLALLAAAGHMQTGSTEVARQYIQLAQDWGGSKKLVSQILIAGVHNSLGRAAVINNQEQRAIGHFDASIATAMPQADVRLLGRNRIIWETTKLGLLPQAADNWGPTPFFP